MCEEMNMHFDIPDNLRKFEKSIKNGNIHNIYLLRTEDLEGNITGEAFGKNLVTDNGLTSLWGRNTLFSYIYLGYSNNDPTFGNSAIYDPLLPTSTIVNDKYNIRDEYGPVVYDKDTRMFSIRFKVTESHINYNISGVSEPLEFKELGLGSNYNNLIVHSSIYDIEGNKSSIIKNPNEKLTITAYLVGCIKADLINYLYDNGIYAFMSPKLPWYNQSFTSLYRSMRNNRAYNASGTDTDETSDRNYSVSPNTNNVSENIVTLKITIPDQLYEDRYDYISSTYFGESIKRYGNQYYQSNDYLTILTNEKLTEPEELITQWGYTNDCTSPMLDKIFGLNSKMGNYYKQTTNYAKTSQGELPVTDFKITSMSMYNHFTKEWDIDESYHNTDRDYNDFIWSIANVLQVNLNRANTISNVFIYINPQTKYPIKSFNYKSTNSDTFRLFATDEYWDSDTYIEILNIDNIPEELQQKRYYIRLGGSNVVLIPEYTKEDYHYLIPKTDVRELTDAPTYDDTKIYYINTCSSDEYEYFVSKKHIVFPDMENGPKYFPINFYDGSYFNDYSEILMRRWTTTNGDRFIQGYDANNDLTNRVYRIYDMSQPKNNDTLEYTTITMETNFYHKNNQYRGIYTARVTWSGNGFLCANDSTSNICEILDVYGNDGNTPTTHTIENSKLCIALNLTDNCVYQRSDITDEKVFEIYDMKNKEVIDTFTIPENEITYMVRTIFGWREFIYIPLKTSQNNYVIFFYDYINKTSAIIDKSVSISDTNLNSNIHSNFISNEEVFILQPVLPNQYNNSSYISYYISSTDPTNICEFHEKYNYKPSLYYGGNAGQLKYTPDKKHLLFISTSENARYWNESTNGNTSSVYDMGYTLDNGKPERFPERKLSHPFDSRYTCVGDSFACLYKNGVYSICRDGKLKYYPIEYFLPHQITGTTKTINAYNAPFTISNKEFSISFTNNIDKIMNTE